MRRLKATLRIDGVRGLMAYSIHTIGGKILGIYIYDFLISGGKSPLDQNGLIKRASQKMPTERTVRLLLMNAERPQFSQCFSSFPLSREQY